MTRREYHCSPASPSDGRSLAPSSAQGGREMIEGSPRGGRQDVYAEPPAGDASHAQDRVAVETPGKEAVEPPPNAPGAPRPLGTIARPATANSASAELSSAPVAPTRTQRKRRDAFDPS